MRKLSLKARIGCTLLLLFDLGVGGAIASLWATETDLPARTQAAIAASHKVTADEIERVIAGQRRP